MFIAVDLPAKPLFIAEAIGFDLFDSGLPQVAHVVPFSAGCGGLISVTVTGSGAGRAIDEVAGKSMEFIAVVNSFRSQGDII